MSSNSNHEVESPNTNDIEEPDEASRVVETKHVFPEDYECRSCVKKEEKCVKPPKLDESICRAITTNKLNETLRNQKCAHCGKAIGQCQCLSDEARRELTKIHEYKEAKKEGEEGIESVKKN